MVRYSLRNSELLPLAAGWATATLLPLLSDVVYLDSTKWCPFKHYHLILWHQH